MGRPKTQRATLHADFAGRIVCNVVDTGQGPIEVRSGLLWPGKRGCSTYDRMISVVNVNSRISERFENATLADARQSNTNTPSSGISSCITALPSGLRQRP